MSQRQSRGDRDRSVGFIEELAEIPEEFLGTKEYRSASLAALDELIWQISQVNVQTEAIGADLGGGTQLMEIPPEGAINLETESWTLDSTGPLSSSTTENTFTSDLTAGQEATIVEAVSDDENVVIQPLRVGSTLHEADVDGDGNADESVIRYHYDYQRTPGGQWRGIQGMTGVWPHGSIANPTPVVPKSVIAPVYGFRIRYENLSDEQNLVDTTVPADEMRSVLEGRAFDTRQVGPERQRQG